MNDEAMQMEVDPRCEIVPDVRLGPFARLGDGRLLTIGDNATFTSSDEGRRGRSRR